MTDTPEDRVEQWFQKRRLTLDLTNLTDEERREGSVLMGGSSTEFIRPDQEFDMAAVGSVVFEWGDPRIFDVFAWLLEHNDLPSAEFFPFTASTIVGDMVWTLDVQAKGFSPESYFSTDCFVEVPLDREEGARVIGEVAERPHPWPDRIAKIGTRWVLFSIGTKIR